MALVKFHTRTLDKASGVIYEPSSEFVEVSEAFALRIKELMKDARHKDSWEFEGVSKVDAKKESIELTIDGKQLAEVISKPRKRRND